MALVKNWWGFANYLYLKPVLPVLFTYLLLNNIMLIK